MKRKDYDPPSFDYDPAPSGIRPSDSNETERYDPFTALAEYNFFFRQTPYGFRQVVQHVTKHVAFGIN